MSEAFDKFQSWKSAGTVVQLVVSERGNGPEVFFVQVSSIDEVSYLVGFVDPKTNSLLPPISFADAIFVVGKSSLEAVHPSGDILMCEEKVAGHNL
jgi:hypothetical protein